MKYALHVLSITSYELLLKGFEIEARQYRREKLNGSRKIKIYPGKSRNLKLSKDLFMSKMLYTVYNTCCAC